MAILSTVEPLSLIAAVAPETSDGIIARGFIFDLATSFGDASLDFSPSFRFPREAAIRLSHHGIESDVARPLQLFLDG